MHFPFFKILLPTKVEPTVVVWFKDENVPSSTVFEKKASKKKDDRDF